MKKITKLLSILLAIAVLLTSFPLQTEAAVKLNKTKTTIYIGQTRTLKLTGTKKEVVWTTSSKKIATVDSKGKVTAKKSGTAIITAKVGKKSYKCTVTVKKPYISDKKKTIYIGSPYTLKLNGTEIKSVQSSDKKVATVSSNGKVTGKKEGTATITLKGTNGKSYKCKVTIKKISINETKMELGKGENFTLKLKGTEIKSTKSSNTNIATVTKSGKVTGKEAGTATITLTGKNGKSYKCKVTVSALPFVLYKVYDTGDTIYFWEEPVDNSADTVAKRTAAHEKCWELAIARWGVNNCAAYFQYDSYKANGKFYSCRCWKKIS